MLREREVGERRIVPFSIPPSRQSVRQARDGLGTVLLFTGVRYSRMTDEAAPAEAAKASPDRRGGN